MLSLNFKKTDKGAIMTLELFVSILVISATATSAAVELLKKFLDKCGIPYNTVPVAVITAFLIGIAEFILFSLTHGMTVNGTALFYSLCMGIANTLSSTCGYDLTKKLIDALWGKAK